MRATQQDREIAQAFAVPVNRVYTLAFGVGAGLAAVAGALIVPIQQAHYLMGLDALLLSFVVVILGGLGSLRGTLVAALLVGLSDGLISVFFSPTLAKIVATLAGGPGPGGAGPRPLRRGGGVRGGDRGRVLALHLAVVGLLAGLQLLLPPFHHGMLARIMVLAAYAVGYNVLLGYTGLMSLGHAMFFAAGMYGTGLTVHHLGFGVAAGFLAGAVAGLAVAGLVGLLTLRTTGPAFLIVTMMLAQAFYLATLYWNGVTGGDQGFILAGLHLELAGRRLALAEPAVKYNVALAVFTACLLVSLGVTRSPVGRVLVAVRENEERTRLLGYNTYRYRLFAVLAVRAPGRRRGLGVHAALLVRGLHLRRHPLLDLPACSGPSWAAPGPCWARWWARS